MVGWALAHQRSAASETERAEKLSAGNQTPPGRELRYRS